jgi:Rrf2 family nitric oxide-sensitive transcriptional repressor
VNRLNRKVEYALMALKVMSQKRQGELTSVKEVIERTSCPFDATARVLQQMAQRGILRSEQGAHGGYLLVRDLNKISLYDLMDTVLGPVAVAKCLHTENDCDLKSTCNIISPIQILNRRMNDFYHGVSLGELFRSRAAEARLEVAP